MKKNIMFVTGVFVLLFIVAGSAFFRMQNRVSVMTGFEPRFIYDPSNDREVVGAFQNVFTGKVVANLGSAPYDAVPQTQFTVEVAHNIKGNLRGTVTISQLGGYKDGALYVLNEEGGLYALDTERLGRASDTALQVGSTYLFATRYNPTMDWHVLSSHPSGVKLLSTDAALNRSQIIELSQKDERVKELQETYEHEIIPRSDVSAQNR